MLSSLVLASLVAPLGLAFPLDSDASNLQARAACSGNTATTRSEWCDFDLTTDYYSTAPDTGVTREYWFEITDTTASPDGVSRYVQTINGSIPGPTIVADWGDTVVVHVTNSVASSTNGTSIHFHGIRQNYTNQNDGVVSITQCPTAPGDSITYTWKATQYGSTWYHSHFGLQAWEGVFGGIVINGPASANYDTDLGHVFLNDWSHQTADELFISAETSGPPTLDNGLINGTNVFGDDGSTSQTGSRFEVAFTSGTSYRLRLVNAAIDTHWKFMIDNHTMTVIANDLVPITPYETTVLSVGIGQRYDIIVTADQAAVADNFWMRAIPQIACSDNDSPDNIKGIVYYGTAASTPTTSAYDYTDSCEDEASTSLVPALSKTVDSAVFSELEGVTVGRNSDSLFRWYLNSTTMLVDWANPTLAQVIAGNTTYETDDAVITLSTADAWAYVVIETTLGVPHPIHLHGFDFFILSQATGTYDASTTTLNLDNPPRRDTAMLPASGHLVLAFQTDNPGAWLMHCHIGWHTAEGFGLQFIVRDSEIPALVDETILNGTCDNWSSYMSSNSITQEDSGI